MPDIVVFSGCWQCADSVTALFDNFRKRYFVNNRKFSPVSVSFDCLSTPSSLSSTSFILVAERKPLSPPRHPFNLNRYFWKFLWQILCDKTGNKPETTKVEFYEWNCQKGKSPASVKSKSRTFIHPRPSTAALIILELRALLREKRK